MGKDKNAGANAAAAQTAAIQQGIDALDPFLQAGAEQLPGLAAGATPEGLDATIQQLLNTDVFGSLVGERQTAAQGQLAAGGLTRSGQALETAANIPTELALALESMLTGRSSNLAGQALGAGNSIATQFGQQGQALSSGILTDAQTQAGAVGNALSLGSSIFFSDPRLKINVEQVAEIGDLAVYEWDWIPEAEGTVIMDSLQVGFMADEVEEKYPDHVATVNGWKMINYPALCADLRAKYVN